MDYAIFALRGSLKSDPTSVQNTHDFDNLQRAWSAEVCRRQHLRPFWHLHIGETIVGDIHMKFRKREPLLSILLDTGLNLLDSFRERLPDNMEDVRDRVRDVGNSPILMEVLRRIETVAPTDSTVLILGETGSGKELIARAIHSHSNRKNRPLVKVNCGAIPTGLVESELFGHMKGAFTGALERRTGRFELADGGTLFLDEISELPLDTQVKLLRVLQEHEFEPVGSSRTIKVNVRIIAASNRDLEKGIQEGRFRADLYYRLNVLPMTLPALRHRRSDIALLTAFFVERFSRQFGKQITGITQETMDLLSGYGWPGNIRELQNVIERAVVLSCGPVLKLGRDLLPLSPGDAASANEDVTAIGANGHDGGNPAGYASLEEVEKRHIMDVLRQTEWIIEGPRGAAKILVLHPNTLRSRMKKLGIERVSMEAPSATKFRGHEAS